MNNINKRFEQIEHLSDIGIKIYGNSLEQLFESAAEGMFSIMCDLKKINPAVKRNISIEEHGSMSLEELLVLWLENLLYKFEIDNMLFSRFKIKKFLTEDSRSIIEADIFGEKVDFGKHEIVIAVKAPTYHMLEVRKDRNSSGWAGKVIFDV